MELLALQLSSFLLLIILGASSCDGAASNTTSSFTDCGTNYTTLERAIVDTGDNYYKIWTTFYPPGRRPPLYIDITYNFLEVGEMSGGVISNGSSVKFVTVENAVFLFQPPRVFTLTSLFAGHISTNRIVSLDLALPSECEVLVNDTRSVEDTRPPPLLQVLSHRVSQEGKAYSYKKPFYIVP